MSQPLKIRLLGGFAIYSGNFPQSTISSRRQQMLLTYLLLNRDAAQSRQQISFMLWPDSTDTQARTNLRQLLHRLRSDCSAIEPFLYLRNQSIHWRTNDDCWVDVVEFEQLLARAEAVAPSSPGSAGDEAKGRLLETAVSLYTGDLLPDCYDDWIEDHRRRLRRQYLMALQRLVTLRSSQHDYPAAIPFAEQLIVQDPLNEAGYRHLMQLQALNNDGAGALRTYQSCKSMLNRELGVAPDPETKTQYEQILKLEKSPVRPLSVATDRPPLIGREREWVLLQQAWQRTRSGQAHFVLIRGEAGIGKTRLIEELARWAELQGAAVVQARAYVAQDQLAYAPIAVWLRNRALGDKLASLDNVWLAEAARLLPELLAVHPHLPAPQPMTDGWQRQRFYEALARAILLPAEERPLVLILDDLQWCDRQTLSWLSYLFPAATGKQLLFVTTLRSGSVAADHPLLATLAVWRAERELTEIKPRPLDPIETGRLAEVVAGRELSAEEAAVFSQETEGVPLFIVEYARAALEKISGPSPALQTSRSFNNFLPPRVQAMVEARMAQLSEPARELMEVAAAIGREFTLNVLIQAGQQDEEQLVVSLDELWQRHIIREREDESYDFSHDKLRAVAYDRISTARRRLLHKRLAEALITIHAHDTDPVSAQLANQYEKAHQMVEAITYYQQAAEVAGRMYANEDVVELLSKALSLQVRLPPGPERDAQELSLNAALGPPLVALEGYAAQPVITVYERILALCDRLNQPPDPRALRGLAIAHIVLGRHRRAADFCRQLLERAETVRDPVLLVEGHYATGVSAFWQGKFAVSRIHLEKALVFLDPELRDEHIGLYSQDPEVICLSRLAYTHWYMGFPDQAWRLMDKSLNHAESLAHPYSLAYARSFAVRLAFDTLDFDRFELEVSILMQHSASHHFGYQHENAALFQGYILARQGQHSDGLRQMHAVLAKWRRANFYMFQPAMLSLVAHAYLMLDNLAEALTTLENALDLCEQNSERYYEAELHRLYGEILAKEGVPVGEAAMHMQRALNVARGQGARIFELRALASLCRLWEKAGDREQLALVRQALQQCYDTFTEGENIPDLKAACAILLALP
jgi:DNA-binding SARP family transcriptional activator/tetratricopeptide (TPR) repeat protein